MSDGESGNVWVRWWRETTESKRDAVRLGAIALGLAAVGTGGYFALQPWWRGRQHQQALAQATQFAETRDYREMLLALRRATELAPGDVATWQEVARRLSEIGAPEALVARENVARLAPTDAALRMALVTEALRFGELSTAKAALAQLDGAAQREAAFHRLAAAIAMAGKQEAELEQSLMRLLEIDPQDATARFNLAAVRLWSVDEAKARAALAELEALTAEPAVRVRAALELLKHAARRREADRVTQVVALLLRRLSPAGASVVPVGDPPGWTQLLDALRGAAEKSPADVALTARWLADVRLAREALVWIDGLPAAVQQAPAVQDVAGELSAKLGDAGRLAALLRGGAWGPVNDDVVTLALAAKVQSGRGRQDRANETWNDAVGVAASSAGALRVLVRLADVWGDGPAAERALNELIERWPKIWWAYEALRARLALRADTAGLWQLYSAWRRARPDDGEIAREWVMLSAVLDRAGPEALAQAQRLAAEKPQDPRVSVALAAALWRAKRPAEAAKLVAAWPAELRNSGDTALWTAVIFAEVGRKTEAREALSRLASNEMPEAYAQLARLASAKLEGAGRQKG